MKSNFAWFFLGFTALLFAGCGTENVPVVKHTEGVIEQTAPVEITGTVHLVGSDPSPELVISAARGRWYIAAGEDTRKLFDLQHQTVTVTGTETVHRTNARALSLVFEKRILGNIAIIRVQSSIMEEP